MLKKLIALAVAGLVSAPAFAQSNVTVYGVADLGIASISGDSQRVTGLADGAWAGSRLGVRGTEDLGGGLKALFTLEYGLDLDNNSGVGTGADTARQQFVGLSGGFGTVVGGRLQTPGFAWAGKYVPLGGYASVHDFLVGQGAGYTIEDSNRLNNAVAYVSPNISGLTATVAYSFAGEVNDEIDILDEEEEVIGHKEKDSVLGIGLDYTNGPVSVGFVYHGVKNFGQSSVAGAAEDINEYALGGSYDFGVVKAFVTYNQRDISFVKESGEYEDDIWTVGVAVPVGAAGSFSVAYGKFDGDKTDTKTATGLKNEADAWSVGYTHALSKRTSLYAMYARMSTEDGYIGQAALSPTKGGKLGVGGDTISVVGGEDYTRTTVGISHKF